MNRSLYYKKNLWDSRIPVFGWSLNLKRITFKFDLYYSDFSYRTIRVVFCKITKKEIGGIETKLITAIQNRQDLLQSTELNEWFTWRIWFMVFWKYGTKTGKIFSNWFVQLWNSYLLHFSSKNGYIKCETLNLSNVRFIGTNRIYIQESLVFTLNDLVNVR